MILCIFLVQRKAKNVVLFLLKLLLLPNIHVRLLTVWQVKHQTMKRFQIQQLISRIINYIFCFVLEVFSIIVSRILRFLKKLI